PRGRLLQGRPVSASLVELDDVVVQFPLRRRWPGGERRVVHAVNGVSFAIGEGETLALVGESGCGKTTLGRTLVGLVEPTGGCLRFRGQALDSASASELKATRGATQMVFQDPFSSLAPRMPVADILAEPLVIHGLGGRAARLRAAHRMIQMVGLPADALGL